MAGGLPSPWIENAMTPTQTERGPMLKRRALLAALAAVGLVPGFQHRVAASPESLPPNEEAKKLNALFDRFVQQQLQRNPEFATSLGIDHGALAPLKYRLSDVSLAALAKDRTTNTEHLAAMKAIDRSKLHSIDTANYDTVFFLVQTAVEANKAFAYAGGDAHSPYQISQLSGAYHDVPDFLDTQHEIKTVEDADAYLSRMNAMAVMLGQELEVVQHDAGIGVTPPDFVIDKILIQMQVLLNTPAEKAVLVQSLVRRAKEAGLKADYTGQASTIYTTKIIPALAKQVDYFKAARKPQSTPPVARACRTAPNSTALA